MWLIKAVFPSLHGGCLSSLRAAVPLSVFPGGSRGGGSFMTQDNLKPQLRTCPAPALYPISSSSSWLKKNKTKLYFLFFLVQACVSWYRPEKIQGFYTENSKVANSTVLQSNNHASAHTAVMWNVQSRLCHTLRTHCTIFLPGISFGIPLSDLKGNLPATKA